MSPLWRGRRAYAEDSGRPWFILSAKHGLVAPDELLEPYDLALADVPAAGRAEWGETVVAGLTQRLGSLEGQVLELHAGSRYRQAIEGPLGRAGGELLVPLEGLRMGHQLAWYSARMSGTEDAQPPGERRRVATAEEVAAARVALETQPDRLPASDWPGALQGLDQPGLYSWWVGEEGADALSQGLDEAVRPGRIYAGQAGATKWPSGKVGKETLGSRIGRGHLGGRIKGSTFRLTLAAALACSLELQAVGPTTLQRDAESRLTDWMREHLEVAVHPFEDRDPLGDLEHRVLKALDPPLNLGGTDITTPARRQLRMLRGRLARPPLPG